MNPNPDPNPNPNPNPDCGTGEFKVLAMLQFERVVVHELIL